MKINQLVKDTIKQQRDRINTNIAELPTIVTTLQYLRDRDYITAVISLISYIPALEDIIGKKTAASSFLNKFSRYTKSRSTTTLPTIIRLKSKLKEYKNQLAVKEVLGKAKQHRELQVHVNRMQSALQQFLKN